MNDINWMLPERPINIVNLTHEDYTDLERRIGVELAKYEPTTTTEHSLPERVFCRSQRHYINGKLAVRIDGTAPHNGQMGYKMNVLLYFKNETEKGIRQMVGKACEQKEEQLSLYQTV